MSLVDARNKILKTRIEQERRALANGDSQSEHDAEIQPLSEREHNNQEGNENLDVLRGPNSLDVSMYSVVDTEKAVVENTYIKAYAELAQVLFGDIGYSIVTVTIYLQCMMAVIGYLYFINEFIPSWAATLVMIPVCMFFHLRLLSYISFVAILLSIASLAIIIGTVFVDLGNDKAEGEPVYFDPVGLPLYFGICVFMYEGDVVALSIQDSMQKPRGFRKVAFSGMIFITFFYLIVCIMPYYAYLDNTEDQVLDAMTDSTLVSVVKIIYPIAII